MTFHVDLKRMSVPPMFDLSQRLLPNSLFGRIADFAGEIVDPNGCDRFKIFGKISSRISFRTRHGAFALAQYTFGSAETIVHGPETIPVNEASGIALVAVTAYQALFDSGKLQPGQNSSSVEGAQA